MTSKTPDTRADERRVASNLSGAKGLQQAVAPVAVHAGGVLRSANPLPALAQVKKKAPWALDEPAVQEEEGEVVAVAQAQADEPMPSGDVLLAHADAAGSAPKGDASQTRSDGDRAGYVPPSTGGSSFNPVWGLVGLGGLALAAGGGGGSPAPASPTFFVLGGDTSVIRFDGTATGAVTITVDALGQATFTRAGIAGGVTVADIGSKTLDVAPGALLDIRVSGDAVANRFILNAPNAATIRFSGEAGAGADTIELVIPSASSAPDLRLLRVDASQLSGVEAIRFVFPEDARDVVQLSADSDLSGFSEIEVSKGGVDLTAVAVQPGVAFIVNSTLILSLEQLKTMASLVSITGLGKLTIDLTAAEADEGLLLTYLESLDAKPVLIGTTVTLTRESVPYDLSGPASDAISLFSFPGIPELDADIANLQSQIDALTTGAGADVTQLTSDLKTLNDSLTALQTTLTELSGVVVNNDTALKSALAELQTALAGADTVLDDKIAALATRLDADIADLQEQIGSIADNSSPTLGATLDSIAGLKAAVTALQGAGLGDPTDISSVAGQLASMQAAIELLQERLDALGAPPTPWIADPLQYSAVGIFGGLALQVELPPNVDPQAVDFGFLVDALDPLSNTNGPPVMVTLADVMDPLGYTVPEGKILLSISDFILLIAQLQTLDVSGLPTEVLQAFLDENGVAAGQGLGALVESDSLLASAIFRLGANDLQIVSAEALRAMLLSITNNDPAEDIEVLIGQMATPITIVAGNGPASVGFTDAFAQTIAGFDAGTIDLTVSTPLSVAQAVALADRGFDLDTQVSFGLRDYFTTVQAALSNPAQRLALVNALQVVAQGNENPNAMDFTAFDGAIRLRIEGGAGNDSINTGRGNDTVVGGLGSDTIALTTSDASSDTIVFETTQDGGGRPVVRLVFSTDADPVTGDYRVGSQLSVRINGQTISVDAVANNAADSLQALRDAIWQKLGNDGEGLNGPLSDVLIKGDGTIHLVGLTPETVVHVTPTGSLSPHIDNPGQRHAETVGFSINDADYTAETYVRAGQELARSLRISVKGATATYEVEVAMADTAAGSLQALATAVQDKIAADTAGTGIAQLISGVAVDTSTGVITLTAAQLGTDTFDVTVAEIDVAGTQEQRALAFSTDPTDYFAGGKLRFTLDADGDSTTTADSVLVEADMVAGDPLGSMQNLVDRINVLRDGGSLQTVLAGAALPSETFKPEATKTLTTASFSLNLSLDEPFLIDGSYEFLFSAIKEEFTGPRFASVFFNSPSLPPYAADPSKVLIDNIQTYVDGLNQGVVVTGKDRTDSSTWEPLSPSPFVFSYDALTGLLTLTANDGYGIEFVSETYEIVRFNLDEGITLTALEEGAASFTLGGIEIDEFGTQEVETVRFSTDSASYFAGGQLSLSVNGHLYAVDMAAPVRKSPAAFLVYTDGSTVVTGTEVVALDGAALALTLVDSQGTLTFNASLTTGVTSVNDLLQQINTALAGRATVVLAPEGTGILITTVQEGADVSLSLTQSLLSFGAPTGTSEPPTDVLFTLDALALADEGTGIEFGSTAYGGSKVLAVNALTSLQNLVDTINADANRTVNAERVEEVSSVLVQALRVVTQPAVEYQLSPSVGDGAILVNKGFAVVFRDGASNLVRYALSSATPTTDTLLGDAYVRFDSVDAYLSALQATPVLVDFSYETTGSYSGPSVMTPSFDAGTGLLRFTAIDGLFEAGVSSLDHYPVVFQGDIRLTAIEPGANGVVVDATALDTAGVREVESVAFSKVDADYFEGGKLSVTVAGQVIQASMVAGDAEASLNALRVAVEEARGGTYLEPTVGHYSIPVGLSGLPSDYEIKVDGIRRDLQDMAGQVALGLALGTDGKAAAALHNNADGELVLDIYVIEPLVPGSLPVTGIPLVANILLAGTDTVAGQFVFDLGLIAARDPSVINPAVAAELGSVSMQGASLVFTAKNAGAAGVSITDAEIDFAGTAQQSTASFSTLNADYVEGGTVSVTFTQGVTTETVSVNMVAGSVSQTLEALREAVGTELAASTGGPAVLRLNATGLTGDSVGLSLKFDLDFDADGTADYSNIISGGGTISSMLKSMVDGSTGRLASAEVVNGEVVITTSATGAKAYIGVGGDAAASPVERGFFLQTFISGSVEGIDVSASGSDASAGVLAGIVGDVSLSNGTLTFTAAQVGPDFFALDQASATMAAVQQVTELDFSAASADDFRYTVYTDGNRGEVSVNIAGQTVTADMGDGKFATLYNLQEALVLARDGAFTTGNPLNIKAKAVTGVDAVTGGETQAKGASITIDLSSFANAQVGSATMNIAYSASGGVPTPFQLSQAAVLQGPPLVDVATMLGYLQAQTGQLVISYDPQTMLATVTTAATGTEVQLIISSLSFTTSVTPVGFLTSALEAFGTDAETLPGAPAQVATVVAEMAIDGVNVELSDRLAPAAIEIGLLVNGQPVNTTFQPASGATVQDLLDFIGNIAGVDTATLVNGVLTITTDASGGSALLAVTDLNFNTASFTTEPLAAIANALGTVEIVGDKLVMTAKTGGADPLQVGGFTGTQEDAANSTPHVVDLMFANSTLDTAADGTRLTVTLGGVTVLYTVNAATEGAGDRSNAILQAVRSQMLADPEFVKVVASVENAVDGALPIPNALRFTSVLNGPNVLGTALNISVSITDAIGNPLTVSPATFDLVQAGTITRGTSGGLGAVTNDNAGEGAAVDGAAQGLRADDASATDSLSVTNSSVSGVAADPKAQAGTVLTAGVDPNTSTQGAGTLVTAGVEPGTTAQGGLQPSDTTPVDGVDPTTAAQTVTETVNGFDAFTDQAVSTVLQAGGDADTVLGFQLLKDTVVLEGALAATTLAGTDIDHIAATTLAPTAFDLDAHEFGFVGSAFYAATDGAFLSSSLTDQGAVVDLLNAAFAFGKGTADAVANTSVFAVTASDDITQTALWVHTQSSPGDNSVTLDELSLLAIVHTTENRFDSLLEFGALNMRVQPVLIA